MVPLAAALLAMKHGRVPSRLNAGDSSLLPGAGAAGAEETRVGCVLVLTPSFAGQNAAMVVTG